SSPHPVGGGSPPRRDAPIATAVPETISSRRLVPDRTGTYRRKSTTRMITSISAPPPMYISAPSSCPALSEVRAQDTFEYATPRRSAPCASEPLPALATHRSMVSFCSAGSPTPAYERFSTSSAGRPLPYRGSPRHPARHRCPHR